MEVLQPENKRDYVSSASTLVREKSRRKYKILRQQSVDTEPKYTAMPTENEIDRAKRVKSDSRVTEMIVRLANDEETCSVTTTAMFKVPMSGYLYGFNVKISNLQGFSISGCDGCI